MKRFKEDTRWYGLNERELFFRECKKEITKYVRNLKKSDWVSWISIITNSDYQNRRKYFNNEFLEDKYLIERLLTNINCLEDDKLQNNITLEVIKCFWYNEEKHIKLHLLKF